MWKVDEALGQPSPPAEDDGCGGLGFATVTDQESQAKHMLKLLKAFLQHNPLLHHSFLPGACSKRTFPAVHLITASVSCYRLLLAQKSCTAHFTTNAKPYFEHTDHFSQQQRSGSRCRGVLSDSSDFMKWDCMSCSSIVSLVHMANGGQHMSS